MTAHEIAYISAVMPEPVLPSADREPGSPNSVTVHANASTAVRIAGPGPPVANVTATAQIMNAVLCVGPTQGISKACKAIIAMTVTTAVP